MATTASFGSLVDPQEESLQRQRAYAQALRQQGQEPIQQQVVAGRVVPISWTQGLASMLKSYSGRKLDEDLDVKAAELRNTKKAQGAADIQGIVDALRGKSAQSFETPANEMGDQAATQNIPAQAPDANRALALALKSDNPMAQGLGASLLASQMPKATKWEKVEKPMPDGSKQVGFVDISSSDPWSTFKAGGTAPVKQEFVNGQGVNPYTGQTQGTAIPKQLAPDSVVAMGPGGQLVPNQPVLDAKKAIAKAGASNIGLSVNTAMKPLLGEVGKGAGEQINSDFAGARAAQSVLQNVDQIKSGLGNAILGPAANARVTLSQIGQVLGVNGKDATEQLQNTRNVMQGLARQELAAAGAMKGQGQITESERAILRKAESGQINEMTKPEVESMLNALTKTAKHRISVHEGNLQRLEKDPNAADVVKFMRLPGQMAPSGGGSVLDAADAILRGRK